MSREVKILLGLGVAVAIGVSALLVAGSKDTAKDTQSGSDGRLVREDSYQTHKGAKVTLVEFGDYQCPACGLAQPIVEQLKAKYQGQLNVVFRQFPLSMHQHAQAAAEATEAAGAQGKFFEMTNLLYQNQSQWAESPNPVPLFVSYAQSLGLAGSTIQAAVQNQQYAGRIQRDMADGEALNLSATPSFFVNGGRVQNAYSLQAAIEAELKK